jgi:hypothetical protein
LRFSTIFQPLNPGRHPTSPKPSQSTPTVSDTFPGTN